MTLSEELSKKPPTRSVVVYFSENIKSSLQPKIHHKVISCDGNKVFVYLADKGRAASGKKDSGWSRQEFYEANSLIDALYNGGIDFYTMEQRYRKRGYDTKGIKAIGWKNIEGNKCIVLEFITEMQVEGYPRAVTTKRFWVDPARDFSVRKLMIWSEGGTYPYKILSSEAEYVLRQYHYNGGSIWANARIVQTSYDFDPKTNKPYKSSYQITTYNPGFDINGKVADKDIKLKLPPATSITEGDALYRDN